MTKKTNLSKFFFLTFSWLLVFLLTAHHLFAQVNTDSLLVVARRAKAKKDLPTALRNYLQVMKVYEQAKDSPKQTQKSIAKQQLTTIYIEIGKIYEEGSLYENALDYFKKSNTIEEKANTNELIANGLLESKKYKEALEAYSKALKTYKAEANYKATIRNLQQIVNCYKKLGQYDKALENNVEILGLARNAKDKQEEANALNNIGYIYRYLKNYNKALDYLNQTLSLKRQSKESAKEELITLVNIGVVNQNMGNYTNALGNLTEALQIAQKQKDTPEVCKIQDLIAVVYLNSKDVYNAEIYNELAISVAEKLKNPVLLQTVYETKSNILQAKEDFQNALDYYKKYSSIRDSIELAEKIAQQELLYLQFLVERSEKVTFDSISQEEATKATFRQMKDEMEKKRLEDEKEAEKRNSEVKIAKANLKNQKLATEVAQRELKIAQQQSEAERKDRELAELDKTRIEQELEIEKNKAADKEKKRQIAQLEQDKKIQALERQTQEEENKFLYAVLALILLSTILTVWGLANTRKKNKLLAQKNDEIEVKNVELEQTQEELKAQRDTLAAKSEELDLAYNNIKASITYAKRIQNAILPPISLIQQYLEESFVLYKPRDIVSGDFYWFAPISQQYSVIAAVDCTGHGVPGAFMSMIGDAILTQIVIEKGILSPDLILHELDKGVRLALRKGESDAKDGMDMSLCVIDKEAKIAAFAGAMNPMCFVQNGELHEIKADKRAIGGEGAEGFSFTKHTIDISIPTTIYLYTDGFQDQFGGAQGRKFMVKRFRELLFEIHQKPINEQKQLLDDTIENWRGSTQKQIDDILVMGIKL
jgi:serine phosphatase RsbU (regulator of sigma subunit)/tetratricopeptide (TPR) repeat protein